MDGYEDTLNLLYNRIIIEDFSLFGNIPFRIFLNKLTNFGVMPPTLCYEC